jgi:signal peptidase II
VVDWIQLPNYPVFNLADSFVVCAAIGIVVLSWRGIAWDGAGGAESGATAPAEPESTGRTDPPDPTPTDPEVRAP